MNPQCWTLLALSFADVFSSLPFPSPSNVKKSIFLFLDWPHLCVACLLCCMRKHTATELLIRSASYSPAPSEYHPESVYLTVLQEMFCMIFFNFIC